MTVKATVLITLPVLLAGGTEFQTLNLVMVLSEAGYDVTICCFHEYDGMMVAQMKMAGARVELLQQNRGDGLYKLFRRLTAYFRKMRPDIVHVQYLAPGLIPVIAARRAGVPTLFATVHQPGRTYGWREKMFLRTATRLSTAFFCVSRAAEESWFGDSALFDPVRARTRRHWTIYNTVDTERISRITEGTDSKILRSFLGIGNRPVIGCVGRLRCEKGQATLLDAMVGVVQRVPQVLLVVIGDGPDRDALSEHARRLGIRENVLFVGPKGQQEVYRLYSIMDVVAVPSVFEGFGLVAAEAMAAGRPVVASDVDGLAEVVENGVTGLLVPPGDVAALATSLCSFFQDKAMALRMGANGKARAEIFSLGQFRRDILSLYKEYLA